MTLECATTQKPLVDEHILQKVLCGTRRLWHGPRRSDHSKNVLKTVKGDQKICVNAMKKEMGIIKMQRKHNNNQLRCSFHQHILQTLVLSLASSHSKE